MRIRNGKFNTAPSTSSAFILDMFSVFCLRCTDFCLIRSQAAVYCWTHLHFGPMVACFIGVLELIDRRFQGGSSGISGVWHLVLAIGVQRGWLGYRTYLHISFPLYTCLFSSTFFCLFSFSFSHVYICISAVFLSRLHLRARRCTSCMRHRSCDGSFVNQHQGTGAVGGA